MEDVIKTIKKLLVFLMVMIGVPLLSGTYQARPQAAKARQLQGETARQFLAEAGILDQIMQDLPTNARQDDVFQDP